MEGVLPTMRAELVDLEALGIVLPLRDAVVAFQSKLKKPFLYSYISFLSVSILLLRSKDVKWFVLRRGR